MGQAIEGERFRAYIWKYETEAGTKDRQHVIENPHDIKEENGFHHVTDTEGSCHIVPAPGVSGCVVVTRPKEEAPTKEKE